tara:strand:- start:5647 stop:6420 length:774 start_codon:yes stop_codon:yes gene_type:complete
MSNQITQLPDRTCFFDGTNPNCTCPTFGFQKSIIEANQYGPNNPPQRRYFCSRKSSSCQKDPNHSSCLCTANNQNVDCKCTPPSKKTYIPNKTTKFMLRDALFCCGDPNNPQNYNSTCDAFAKVHGRVWETVNANEITPTTTNNTTSSSGPSVSDETVESDQDKVITPIANHESTVNPEPTESKTSPAIEKNGGTLPVSSEPSSDVELEKNILEDDKEEIVVTKEDSQSLFKNPLFFWIMIVTLIIIVILVGIILFI